MPHPIRQYLATGLGMIRAGVPERFSPPIASTARWSKGHARAWYAETGGLLGYNFVPSTAGNQLEVWQLDSWDAATIDRELGWAARLGMNSVRVFLHDLLWSSEGEACGPEHDPPPACRRGVRSARLLAAGKRPLDDLGAPPERDGAQTARSSSPERSAA